jgi:transcriptional regulator GlxA family with amidase domain
MAETHASTARVAILAFPEVTASVLYGLYDILLSAGRDWGMIVNGRPGASLMQPAVVSRFRDPFELSNGVQVRPEQTLDECTAPDIIFVPEVAIPPGAPIAGFDAEVAWLRRCHAAGATIATSCSGAMLLAQTGLLDDHDATTHWAYCDVMRTRHPRIRVHSQRALVVSGEGQRLVMAGGGTTWLDLALYLISRHAGLEVAMQTARINLIEWHEIGQHVRATGAISPCGDAAISSQLTSTGERRGPSKLAPQCDVSFLGSKVLSWISFRSQIPRPSRRWQPNRSSTSTRCVSKRRSKCSKRATRRSRRSPMKSATKTPASSAACSGDRSR